MVTTRSSKPSEGTQTKPRQARKRAGREVERLAVDGTERLGGSQTVPEHVSTGYKAGGARWADVVPDDRASRKRKRADDPAEPAGRPPRLARKRRRAHQPAQPDDEAFLRDARAQLKGIKRDNTRKVLRFLRDIQSPSAEHTRRQYTSGEQFDAETTDAFVLSAAHARALLASTEPIDAPVFVANGANTASILETDSAQRPIDQIFDWFADPSEEFEGHCGDTPRSPPTLDEIRERFRTNGRVVAGSSWNFPDMAFPFHHTGMPTFVQQPCCNLLRDVIRFLLDAVGDTLCHADCPNAKTNGEGACCDEHHLTVSEYAEIQQAWRQWQGTVMLAEAGAVTAPHLDQWGFGTWLSCVEGEMGFGYLPRPSVDDARAVTNGTIKPDDRWRYRVLRAGDALYMSSGTPHLVFRLPDGKQTLGLAGHVVRRVDAQRWVELLQMEATEAAAGGDGLGAGFREAVRGLTVGIRHAYDKMMRQRHAEELYGGREQVRRVGKALPRLERVAREL